MEICFAGRSTQRLSVQAATTGADYIADFMCTELKLIIEVDGITHQWEETIKRDEIRQKALESVGFTLLRFSDEEVLNNIQAVFNYLDDWIEKN